MLHAQDVPATTPENEISFSRDIRPILSDRCFHCHGPDATNQESDFRLDTEENAKADLGGYFGIVAGDLESSEVHERIWSEDEDLKMPPPEAVRQLTIDDKKLIDRWIRSGGKYENHWSFVPLPSEIPVPESGGDWARNPIDRFVFRQMATHGLAPQAEATRAAWLRRVTFDLTGLPPTPAEIRTFEADSSPNAFEVVVDGLLASDAFAERMTAEWLDVARYSDTYGYQTDHPRRVWPYRDWVLNAFKQNLGYDEFIIKQLAGDLLPAPTQDDFIATAFNRLHSHKKEGGSNPEEFRVESVADRTHTMSTAFLGLTMECARCHDHKYDPITTKEYYQLGAYFSNIDERGLISFFTNAVPTPAVPVLDEKFRVALANAKKQIDACESNLKDWEGESNSGVKEWLASQGAPGDLKREGAFAFDDIGKNGQLANQADGKPAAKTSGGNQLVEGKHGKAIHLTGDDQLVFPEIGRFDRATPFSFAIWIKPAEASERAVIFCRSRGWDDAGSIGYELVKKGAQLSAKLVHFWPGNAIAIETKEVLQPDVWTHVVLTYDGSSRASGMRLFVDGKLADTDIVQDHLTRQITRWNGGHNDLVIGARYRDRGFKDGEVDEFQVFARELSELEAETLAAANASFVPTELKKRLSKRTVGNNDGNTGTADSRLKEYFELSVSEKHAAARKELEKSRREWNQIMDRTPGIMVMRESQRERTDYVLERGHYESRGEAVEPGTPAALPRPEAGIPDNRLGLAKWLTSPNHPLTARVTVNRYWQLCFGTGIVSTPEDFGFQGSPPSHPELLDWLSRQFVDDGWDVRQLLKRMVLSATYRQRSDVSAAVRQLDPENRWLARSPGKRLSAEMIRDAVLASSGLLNRKWGGPSVKPYDLAAAFKPSAPSKGPSLYRRSVYTYWQRTAPAPLLMTMNANKRDVCRLKRDETNSPLQALLLLNGTQFVEAAKVLSQNLMKAHNSEVIQVIDEAFLRLASRGPVEREREILVALYEEQLARFQKTPDGARTLLETGETKVDAQIDATQLAAMTVVVNAIMSLDEVLRLK